MENMTIPTIKWGEVIPAFTGCLVPGNKNHRV